MQTDPDVTYLALCVLDYLRAVGRPLVKSERMAFRFLVPMLESCAEHGLSASEWGEIVGAVHPDPASAGKYKLKSLDRAVGETSRNGKGEQVKGVRYYEAPRGLTRPESRERVALLARLARGCLRLADELYRGNACKALGYANWWEFERVELAGIWRGRRRRKKKATGGGLWLFQEWVA